MLHEFISDDFSDYLDAAYVGIYKMSTPAILIRDLDLVKEIMQTNFQSFDKNDFIVDEKIDPLISKDPFAALPEKWKHNRGQMSPVFTLSKVSSPDFGFSEFILQSSSILIQLDKTHVANYGGYFSEITGLY